MSKKLKYFDPHYKDHDFILYKDSERTFNCSKCNIMVLIIENDSVETTYLIYPSTIGKNKGFTKCFLSCDEMIIKKLIE